MVTLSSSLLLWPHLSRPTSGKFTFFTSRFVVRRKMSVVMAAAPTTAAKVVPAVIVGGGRVGKALQSMGNGNDLLVKRGEAVPLDFEGPVLVCTRNDDLEAVLEVTPKARWNGIATWSYSFNLPPFVDETEQSFN